MSLTLSAMMPLGSLAPEFDLVDAVTGNRVQMRSPCAAKGTVIAFICNHCPYVQHLEAELVNVANDFRTRNIRFIAINSNDVSRYPEDAPARMKERALAMGYPFPYAFDEGQDTAKAYGAACTPDFFVFDERGACVYRGRFDESRPGSATPVSGADLRTALLRLLEGLPPRSEQQPSIGCSIKWKR